MNANTALKINDAVDQAVMCGESIEDILAQVARAAQCSFDKRLEAERQAFARRIEQARL